MEMVNGYVCKTCTDVGYAKKNIDPAHPKDGPFGVERTDRAGEVKPQDSFGQAVKFDGQLKGAAENRPDPGKPPAEAGSVLDVSA